MKNICIITCNRPSCLKVLLDSCVWQLRAHKSPVCLHILDDTPSLKVEKQNRSVCAASLQSSGLSYRYYGQAEKERFVRLLSSPVYSQQLEFALARSKHYPGKKFGAGNRNYGLLILAGDRVLSLDDDTLFEFYQFKDKKQRSGSSCENPLFLPFADEKRLNRFIKKTELTPLSLLKDLFNEEHPAPGKSTLTMCGIKGGRWYVNPHAVLSVTRQGRRMAWPGKRAYEMACQDPYALLLAPELSFSSSSFFVSTCYGYHSKALLPPFFPGLRAHDAVGAWLYRYINPESPICHLPLAIEHVRSNKAPFSGDDFLIRSAGSSITIRLLFDYLVAGGPQFTGEQALQNLGRRLHLVTELSENSWKELFSEIAINMIGNRIVQLQEILDEAKGTPRWFAKDLLNHIQALHVEALSDSFSCPQDFKLTGDSKKDHESFRSYLSMCGELLCAWPEIWERAVALKASGEFPL